MTYSNWSYFPCNSGFKFILLGSNFIRQIIGFYPIFTDVLKIEPVLWHHIYVLRTLQTCYISSPSKPKPKMKYSDKRNIIDMLFFSIRNKYLKIFKKTWITWSAMRVVKLVQWPSLLSIQKIWQQVPSLHPFYVPINNVSILVLHSYIILHSQHIKLIITTFIFKVRKSIFTCHSNYKKELNSQKVIE